MTISQLCLPNIASHLPWELNSQCTLLQVGHILQCNAFTEQLRQSLACFVRWLQHLTATNEEITSSVDKVSDLGIELKLDSLSHILCPSWGQDCFYFFLQKILSCFMITFLVFQIRCWQLKTLDLITYLTKFRIWFKTLLLNFTMIWHWFECIYTIYLNRTLILNQLTILMMDIHMLIRSK